MNDPKDYIIWFRTNDVTSDDFQLAPLTYNSWDDFQDAIGAEKEMRGSDDCEPVDWEGFLDRDIVDYGLDEGAWDGYKQMFETADLLNVQLSVLLLIKDDFGWDSDEFQTRFDDAFMGQFTLLEWAYHIVDQIGLSDDQAENYFDYEKFGRDLEISGDLSMIIIDEWEDRFDSYEQAEKEYDDLVSRGEKKVGEWYVYDYLGDLTELGDKTIADYFDYEKFAKDLSYEYDQYGTPSNPVLIYTNA